jgi:hypothetical protein
MWLLLRKILPLALVAIYFLIPFDLIPDFLVGPGWIDDLVLIGLLIWYLSGRSVPLLGRFGSPFSRNRGQYRSTSQTSSGSSTNQTHESQATNDPYFILGVRPGAPMEEIKEAYRVAVQKYHPDKVAHLGKDFQELAHRRFVAIQQAYERLTKAK